MSYLTPLIFSNFLSHEGVISARDIKISQFFHLGMSKYSFCKKNIEKYKKSAFFKKFARNEVHARRVPKNQKVPSDRFSARQRVRVDEHHFFWFPSHFACPRVTKVVFKK